MKHEGLQPGGWNHTDWPFDRALIYRTLDRIHLGNGMWDRLHNLCGGLIEAAYQPVIDAGFWAVFPEFI